MVEKKSIVGKVILPLKKNAPDGDKCVAILDSEGNLTVDHPDAKWLLEAQYWIYRREYSPASGPFGVAFLNRMAKVYNGKAEITKQHESDPDVIY